jgi:hypothetical protein
MGELGIIGNGYDFQKLATRSVVLTDLSGLSIYGAGQFGQGMTLYSFS